MGLADSWVHIPALWELFTCITVCLATSQSHILPKPFLISLRRTLTHSVTQHLLLAYLTLAKSVLDIEAIVRALVENAFYLGGNRQYAVYRSINKVMSDGEKRTRG